MIGGRIKEVVVHKHLVPCCDEVYVDVIGNLKVTVHAKET